MTTQTKGSIPIQVNQEHMVKRYFNRSLVAMAQRKMATLVISLVAFSLIALTGCAQAPASQPVMAAPPQGEAVAPAVATENEASGLPAIEALPNIDPADRKFFTPGYGANPGVSREAEALSSIDPADRKFFSTGYGAMSGASKETEELPTIDPADRKFFSPGYGVQTVISREAEVLPTIDPADRKFFIAGYGAQTVMSNESEALPTIDPADRKFFQRSIIFLLK